MKGKQSAFVPRHQIVGVIRFGQSQKKIIAGVVGASYGGGVEPRPGRVS